MPRTGAPEGRARTATVVVRSRLDSPAATVWRHASRMDGVNHELRPLLRMTVPRGTARSLEDLGPGRTGQRLFRSWILLLGIVPVDYDDLTLAEVEPGRRFVERSRTLSARVWQHERTVDRAGDQACVLTDRVRFEPRASRALPVLRRAVEVLFRHRHRQLRRRFGGRRA